jgi:ADP-ribose pyrophosphatase YjhB (NUDIX family)
MQHASQDHACWLNQFEPTVNVVVENDANEILLIRRTDSGDWAVPGGAVDLGESVAQAAVRQTTGERSKWQPSAIGRRR